MIKLFSKKVLSVLVAAMLLLITVVPSFAADALSISETAEVQGSTVVVKLILPENTNLGTLSLTLKYDYSKMTFASCEYASGDVTTSNTKTAGEVGVNAVWNETSPSGGVLVTIIFNIVDGASGKAEFPATVNFATDSANQNVSLSVVTAGVTISVATPETTVEATTTAEGSNVSAGKIPKTSGRYVAIGSAAAVVAATAVVTAVTLKRKKK